MQIERDSPAEMRRIWAQKPKERFTVGRQPCTNFLRGDADIAALGGGNLGLR